LHARIDDYHGWAERHFRAAHSSSPVLGQDNVLVYRPAGPLLVVAADGGRALDVVSALGAGLVSGCEMHLSLSGDGVDSLASREFVLLGQVARVPTRVESPAEIAVRLDRSVTKFERLRWIGGREVAPPDALLRAAAAVGCYVSTRAVLAHGRYELIFNHREQTLSVDFHRYGHLGFRSEGLGEVAGTGVPAGPFNPLA
jgi:RHH-type proline utilization regulon transcriptional repressor/proline dehydrogenase/delta 1-pyrroline-5-carboxylate dehydrogenase